MLGLLPNLRIRKLQTGLHSTSAFITIGAWLGPASHIKAIDKHMVLCKAAMADARILQVSLHRAKGTPVRSSDGFGHFWISQG